MCEKIAVKIIRLTLEFRISPHKEGVVNINLRPEIISRLKPISTYEINCDKRLALLVQNHVYMSLQKV